MTQRKKYIIQIIISLLVCIIFGCLFINNVIELIKNDVQYTGHRTTTVSGNDIVSQILHDINSSREKEALEKINMLKEDELIQKDIKNYFINFEEFIKGTNLIINTNTFIKNSKVLEEYFSKDSKEQILSKASVVPYYLIKKYNAQNKNQKDEISVYKDYIDKFVEGRRDSLNKEGANVICLYVYSRYDENKNNFVDLKNEIARFLKVYKNSLGDNGYLPIQRNYLKSSQEKLRENPNFKPKLLSWDTIKHPLKTVNNIFSGYKQMELYPTTNL